MTKTTTLAQTNSVINNKIYHNADNVYPCTRLLDATRQIGCTGIDGGNYGTLYLVDSDESLRKVPSDAIVILDADYFNGTVLKKVTSGPISGVLVLTDTPKTYPYSPDVTSPNSMYGYYSQPQYNWNPLADEMSFGQYRMPIFGLGFDDSVQAREYGTYNRLGKDPLWGAQLESFMHAATNAHVCLRRGYCQPMGSKSVWSAFTPNLGQRDILMVIAPMDATAFFHGMAVGAESTAYAQVVLLSIMDTFSRVNTSSLDLDLVFAMFNGERWGYLGSNRFVHDVTNFKCQEYGSNNNTCLQPYTVDLGFLSFDFTRVKYIVELNQIGNPLTQDKEGRAVFALNSLASNTNNVNQKALLEYFTNTTAELPNLNVTVASVDPTKVTELPPSSTMTFLKQNSSIAHMVVTDHFGTYTNQHFSSINDLYTNINASILSDTVTYFATLIDRIAGGHNAIVPNATYAEELFYCLTQNYSCGYFPLYSHDSSDGLPPNYANVIGPSPSGMFISAQALFIYQQMTYMAAYKTTDAVCNYEVTCAAGQACFNGACLWSNTHFHSAQSLGIDYVDGYFTITNESYSTWVESNWDFYNVKYFQMGNKPTEIVFLVFGLIEMFIVAGLIFVSQRYLSKRYKLL
ncbi:hypothetical protein SAMD00019534_022470 [Acytostelium subglobosum LB1]|uniref:hypothetical protein n=1 Tax=Acytostelium subglobosum LB1 TaxID=1410327 RepID=UPI0006450064|nr:hypothetical protein SAMD00019534_022470 [Acytostelium subglobosum LB1]GAM19072.1 hypothetical protein SAMD00019534_022470 [Acytostelium subglobosum LB1]|eukprot:XP_012756999.1 hypothetical protein SAMD00019534_022470 [Acytostelium subglobosum LB1]